MAEAFEISAQFPVAPVRVYSAWLHSEQHAAMIGAGADIHPEEDGRFSVWDGYITGRNLRLEPPRRIVQSWRTTEFPTESPNSRLELLLEAEGEGTKVILKHSEIPDGQGEAYRQGWIEHYFQPMARYFSDE